MILSEIKGHYDATYSLGDLCLAALQLRKNNLRPFAGPLDWMSSPSLPMVSQLLRNRFEGYMERENLVASGYSAGVDTLTPHLCLTDMAYQIVSSHDFKASENTFTDLRTYPEVRAKLDRRIKRFLDYAKNGKRLLFIRTEGDFEDVVELESVLMELVKNDFVLLIVNHTDTPILVEKSWPLANVCAIDLPNDEKWNGNDHIWREIFNGITVSS